LVDQRHLLGFQSFSWTQAPLDRGGHLLVALSIKFSGPLR
jgi:hypothetical protein